MALADFVKSVSEAMFNTVSEINGYKMKYSGYSDEELLEIYKRGIYAQKMAAGSILSERHKK